MLTLRHMSAPAAVSGSGNDVDAGPWTPNPARGCEGFPLEGQCTVQEGVSGHILCSEGAGKRLIPCPPDWTCKRDGDFYGCRPNK